MTTGPELRILKGHVIDKLRDLPDTSVHCVVTSPPYWGLRDYSRCECAVKHRLSEPMREMSGNTTPENAGQLEVREPYPNCPKCHGTGKDDSLTVIWDAKDGCEHEWATDRWYTNAGSSTGVAGAAFSEPGEANAERIKQGRWREASTCSKCGAWRGQLGLEPTPDLYVRHIVQVFREVRRVLRDDGVMFLNMGDCYAGSWGNQGRKPERGKQRAIHGPMLTPTDDGRYPDVGSGTGTMPKNDWGLKPKDLVGMPWRVAFALQADGWYLRSDIIWAKPNPMPESVTDRPTKAHEYVFLLTKSARYFYDADAVREELRTNPKENYPNRARILGRGNQVGKAQHPSGPQQDSSGGYPPSGHGRNLRTVWTIATQSYPYPESHFATFPEAIVERCIKAGTSERGCCAICEAPWERERGRDCKECGALIPTQS